MRAILGPGNRLLGYIRECGDRKELLAPGGQVLGYYLADKDQTVRPGNVFVGYGDLLMTLLDD